MPPSKNIRSFDHITRVFEAALLQKDDSRFTLRPDFASTGAAIKGSAEKKAFVWRRDAHYLRKLLRNQSPLLQCRFDCFKLILEGATVILQWRQDDNELGTLTSNGKQVEVGKIEETEMAREDADKTLDFALNLLENSDD